MVPNNGLPINHCIHHIHKDQYCRACDEAKIITLTNEVARLKGMIKVLNGMKTSGHVTKTI